MTLTTKVIREPDLTSPRLHNPRRNFGRASVANEHVVVRHLGMLSARGPIQLECGPSRRPTARICRLSDLLAAATVARVDDLPRNLSDRHFILVMLIARQE